jgi:IS30 family transposase
MRSRRRTPAGGVQAEKQRRYVQLIAHGLGNSEARRVVGIDRKTGNRWRYGRKVRNSAGALVIYPPVKIIESRSRSPRYLSELERIRIADLLAAKMSVRGIAEELGRAPSTISREIRRNRDPDGGYRPHHAEHAARRRACKPRKRRIAGDGVLTEVVQRLLSKRWSPEQVAHELRVLFADQPFRWLCKESIYHAIYDTAVALTRPAAASASSAPSAGLAAPRAADSDADDRRAASRGRGPSSGRSLGGRSDHGCREPIGDRHPGRAHDPIPHPPGVPGWRGQHRRSPSGDHRRAREGSGGAEANTDLGSGQELAQHRQITVETGTSVFFCNAHSPWQRGSNENMNGLLRDYFPKGSDLSVHTAQDIGRIATEVNDRPRKTLGWQRPAELFAAAATAA